MSEDINWKTCEHKEYTICNQETDWIDAYCDTCGARLLFGRTGVEPPDD